MAGELRLTAQGSGGGGGADDDDGGGGAGLAGAVEVVVVVAVVGWGVLATVESPDPHPVSPAASAAPAAMSVSRCHTPDDGTGPCRRYGVTARSGIRLQVQ